MESERGADKSHRRRPGGAMSSAPCLLPRPASACTEIWIEWSPSSLLFDLNHGDSTWQLSHYSFLVRLLEDNQFFRSAARPYIDCDLASVCAGNFFAGGDFPGSGVVRIDRGHG